MSKTNEGLRNRALCIHVCISQAHWNSYSWDEGQHWPVCSQDCHMCIGCMGVILGFGSFFISEHKMEWEINRWICVTSWRNEADPEGKDLNLLRVHVPVLPYVHGFRRVTNRVRSQIEAAKMSFLGSLGSPFRHRLRSFDIWNELKGQLSWFSRLIRMPPGCLPVEVFWARPTKRRPKDRPKTQLVGEHLWAWVAYCVTYCLSVRVLKRRRVWVMVMYSYCTVSLYEWRWKMWKKNKKKLLCPLAIDISFEMSGISEMRMLKCLQREYIFIHVAVSQ